MCGVYFIINLIDNKTYIGCSLNIERRLSNHKSALINNRHKNSHLQRAFNLNPNFSNWSFSLKEECSPDERFNREQYWISFLLPQNKLYNLSIVIEGRLTCTIDTKQKISKALSGKKRIFSDNHKYALSISHKGKSWGKHSEESKLQISRNNRKTHRPLSLEEKVRRSNFFRGKSLNKKKIVIAYNGKDFYIFKSIRSASKVLQTSPTTLNKYLKNNNIFKSFLLCFLIEDIEIMKQKMMENHAKIDTKNC